MAAGKFRFVAFLCLFLLYIHMAYGQEYAVMNTDYNNLDAEQLPDLSESRDIKSLWQKLFGNRAAKRDILRLFQPSQTHKAYSMKTNIQYMSPCHFKICNMGKRAN